MLDPHSRDLVARASRLILANQSDPVQDARTERSKASFNSEELAAFTNDGAERLQKRAELTKLLASQPWGDKSDRFFLTRDQEYVKGLQNAVGIW